MAQPWWTRSVAAGTVSSPASRASTGTPAISRRQALDAILATCGIAATTAVAPEIHAAPEPELETRVEDRELLEMQRQHGWSFGAETEDLTFDGATTHAFDPAALAALADDLRPAQGRHTPFYVPTLFQAPWAVPLAALSALSRDDDASPVVAAPLESVLRPIHTREMAIAYERGRALASLFEDVDVRAAVVVDLPGPEAVAFAAGAASESGALDPVFLFDNWPHPRGVVPAHLTLAAAAYYQPLFARRDARAGDGTDARPMFVLDRSRLAPYVDDEAGFDNRHLARVPSADALRAASLDRVLYVAPTSDARELDDLNEDFVDYAARAIEVRVLGVDAFSPGPAASAGLIAHHADHRRGAPTSDRYHYGGSHDTHPTFWSDYPWAKSPPHHQGAHPPALPRPGASYVPALRASAPPHESVVTAADPASNLCGSSTGRRGRSCVGHVQVLVAVATGAVVAAAAARSGTLGRVRGGSGG